MNNKINVVIPFNKNAFGLVYTLTMLQNQTMLPDKIIVIDTSVGKKGLEIAKIFSYGEVPLVVEVASVNIYTAWNKGIQLTDEESDVLIINDDLIFPINFLEVLNYARTKVKALAHVPVTSSANHKCNHIDQKYKYKAEGPFTFEETEWLSGFCFMLTRKAIKDVGLFDDKAYKVWFGDNDYGDRVKKYAVKYPIVAINLIKGIFVYHFSGQSYRYNKKSVMDLVKKDRMVYFKKNKHYGKN